MKCPVCAQFIDYCPGHGEIGDPEGHRILALHDEGDHSECSVDGCDDAYDDAYRGGFDRDSGYVSHDAGWD